MKGMLKYVSVGVSTFFLLGCGGGDDGVSTPKPTPEAKPPGAVALSAPANNEPCEQGVDKNESEREVTFSWSAAENAETYDFQITDLDRNSNTTQSSISGTSTTAVLAKGTPYSWKVVSKSSKSTESGTSPTWKLYLAGDGVENYAPFAADIVGPSDKATVSRNTGKVTLEWEGSDVDGDELTYTVYLDTVDGKQETATALTDLKSTSTDVSVNAGTRYFWRINTSDGASSSFTSVVTFTTE